MNKFGLTAIVVSGLAAALVGVAAPMQAVASAEALPVLEVPGQPINTGLDQSIEAIDLVVAGPRSR